VTGCAGVTTTPGPTGVGVQNRVWALNVTAPIIVGPATSQSSCSRPGFTVSAVGMASGFCVAAEEGSNVYRYVSDGEKVAAENSGYIPNTDIAGNAKSVFYSTDQYSSASEAKRALQIGSENPAGPTASPTWRLTASSQGANWSYGGNVDGGGGVELLTENPLRLLGAEPLDP